jgi:hypothetical protein
MAVIVTTEVPNKLLNAIKASIDDGSVATWAYDSDGDFTHTAEQWKNKAWIRPKITDDGIRFVILSPKGKNLSRGIYGIYHGRFIEMLLVHFDELFSRATATAMPARDDRIRSQ